MNELLHTFSLDSLWNLLHTIVKICMPNPLNKITKRQIELLRDFGHLLREIREMTDDEARQILDRAESNEDDQSQPMYFPPRSLFSFRTNSKKNQM